MNNHETLIKLLEEVTSEFRFNSLETINIIADFLIDHGVTVNRWIPVTERLSEEWNPVLVRSKYGFTTTALYIGVSGKWRFTNTHEFMVKDSVTHWMPLPEAPKEDDHAEENIYKRYERMKNKRKYYRKCGVCGERHEQSEMIRTDNSPNGWICFDCHNAEHPEYDIDEW